jgi:hypothetical protein
LLGLFLDDVCRTNGLGFEALSLFLPLLPDGFPVSRAVLVTIGR